MVTPWKMDPPPPKMEPHRELSRKLPRSPATHFNTHNTLLHPLSKDLKSHLLKTAACRLLGGGRGGGIAAHFQLSGEEGRRQWSPCSQRGEQQGGTGPGSATPHRLVDARREVVFRSFTAIRKAKSQQDPAAGIGWHKNQTTF